MDSLPLQTKAETNGNSWDYEAFLKAKIKLETPLGFDVDDGEINPILKPHHQRAAVRWAVQGGRRALFESFGLGKTIQELEICRIILEKLDAKSNLKYQRSDFREQPKRHRALIVCPLGVRQEFTRDLIEKLGWHESPVFIRRTVDLVCDQCDGKKESEAEACAACDGTGEMFGIFLTNYESLRDNKLDPTLFDVISLQFYKEMKLLPNAAGIHRTQTEMVSARDLR